MRSFFYCLSYYPSSALAKFYLIARCSLFKSCNTKCSANLLPSKPNHELKILAEQLFGVAVFILLPDDPNSKKEDMYAVGMYGDRPHGYVGYGLRSLVHGVGCQLDRIVNVAAHGRRMAARRPTLVFLIKLVFCHADHSRKILVLYNVRFISLKRQVR